jgi:hypothetical protein
MVPIEEIRPGDVIWFSPEKHGHRACAVALSCRPISMSWELSGISWAILGMMK